MVDLDFYPELLRQNTMRRYSGEQENRPENCVRSLR